jgi:hypothetical protein
MARTLIFAYDLPTPTRSEAVAGRWLSRSRLVCRTEDSSEDLSPRVAVCRSDNQLPQGGHGSGLGVSRRPLAESLRRIYLAELGRNQQLTDRHALKVRRVRNSGERVAVAIVYVESTRMYFSGRRLWFRCPRCKGRCRVLYGTWWIACRRCHRLRNLSQREAKEDRATRLKIVRRLNPDDPDPSNDLPPKPRGMQWTTYDSYETYNEK